ncbi:MAG: 3-oxoacyl-ACP synthase III [Deltaproteobacteria bacterium]|nr:3-oxoacyl-ACP synthase III [Deltaproteobacteria bacterium]
MPFSQVSLAAVAHVDAPIAVSSAELCAPLENTMSRLGLRADLLASASGVQSRRWWQPGVQPSQAATWAAEKALAASGVDRSRIGVLINTSVCRDFVEPSTACLVHGNLGLPATCLNFDLGNACLAFMNGMDLAGHLIERGVVEFALIVDGEGSRYVQEQTVSRLAKEDATLAEFQAQFATLTLGSGGAAMVLGRRGLVPDGHRLFGSVSRAATQHSGLCKGQVDKMETDAKTLLFAGLELAGQTWAAAQAELGWRAEALDECVLHQVSGTHTASLCRALGLDMAKVLAIYPEFGNIGPASVPIVLSKAAEAGRIQPGGRVALMGIGSGLNCSMAEVLW